jgi:D-alanine-D-alanine ligase
VFNLVESFGDDNTKEPHVAAYYDLLGLRYTGSGPRGLTMAMDKAVAKKILAFHNVVSPKFAVFWRGRLDRDADDIEFPVIVKPLREDGSIGIGFDALAGNIKELMERIDALTAEFSSPILIEQYIEGREIYMGVLGNAPPEALPPVELDLSHLPKGTPRIAGTEVKWNEGSRAYRGSKIRLPKLPKAVHETMERYALAAFQALGLRDYARIDFRLAGETVYLIEANPNPYLHSGHEFIRGARASGRTHPATILEILECARVRYAAALPR